jgi:hypothetical protein
MDASQTKAGGCVGTQPALQIHFASTNSTSGKSTPQRLRLPAFGRQVAELRANGFAPAFTLLIVDSWADFDIEREHWPWVLVIPDDVPLEKFDLSVAAGLFCYVVGDHANRVEAIARQLDRFGACHPVFCYAGGGAA